MLWALLVWGRRRWRLAQDFGWLNGTYRVTPKLADEPEPGTLSITANKNVLSIKSEPPGDGSYTGEVVMNEQLPRSGEGHYWQMKGGLLLWGLWEVEVVKEEKKLLVHRTYANHKTHAAVVSGFVWEQIAQ